MTDWFHVWFDPEPSEEELLVRIAELERERAEMAKADERDRRIMAIGRDTVIPR
jgi:hypothetical protein